MNFCCCFLCLYPFGHLWVHTLWVHQGFLSVFNGGWAALVVILLILEPYFQLFFIGNDANIPPGYDYTGVPCNGQDNCHCVVMKNDCEDVFCATAVGNGKCIGNKDIYRINQSFAPVK